jgi:hypothetical protein
MLNYNNDDIMKFLSIPYIIIYIYIYYNVIVI